MSVAGGIERVVVNLSNELSKNYNVSIISLLNTKGDLQFKLSNDVKYFNLGHLDSRIRELIFKSFGVLKEIINKNQFDIVFVTGCFPVPVVLPVKIFTPNTKFVFCDHGALMNQYDDKKVLYFRKLAAKYFDKIVTLTERNMDDYIEKLNVKPSKITYIYNWIDEEVYKYKKEYDYESKRIITVGRFTKEKGYDMLIDVAKIVFDKHPDWCWSIFGEGEDFESIKLKVEENELQKNVILEGKSDNIYSEYNKCSMCVLPSYREGLPLVLLEAKALGLPMVSFNCVTGPAEIVNNNVDGFLIEPYDKKDMAEKICTLIENVERRKYFSQNTSKSIDKFNKTGILEKWVNLIDRV